MNGALTEEGPSKVTQHHPTITQRIVWVFTYARDRFGSVLMKID
jgi:hypothetical protein